jgi:hypothetical protein
MKLCKDCEHFIEEAKEEVACALTIQAADPVWGKEGFCCEDERRLDWFRSLLDRSCGKSGRYFKKKP